MPTFTYLESPPDAIRAAFERSLPLRGGARKYPMELVLSDLMTVLDALREATESPYTDHAEAAGALRRDILATLGIEES